MEPTKMQRALEVGSGKNEPSGKHRARERARDTLPSHPCQSSLPEGRDLPHGINLKKPKTTGFGSGMESIFCGGGRCCYSHKTPLANLSNRLSWVTIYPLPNFLCHQYTMVLSPLSAWLLTAWPVTDSSGAEKSPVAISLGHLVLPRA